jgi:hypothetical protein
LPARRCKLLPACRGPVCRSALSPVLVMVLPISKTRSSNSAFLGEQPPGFQDLAGVLPVPPVDFGPAFLLYCSLPLAPAAIALECCWCPHFTASHVHGQSPGSYYKRSTAGPTKDLTSLNLQSLAIARCPLCSEAGSTPFFFFLRFWGLNSGPSPWATVPTFFVIGIFKIGSHQLFSWAGFEPWSSWALPSE